MNDDQLFIRWNPYNQVVQDHRTWEILPLLTNIERRKRDLPIPWKPEMFEKEFKNEA